MSLSGPLVDQVHVDPELLDLTGEHLAAGYFETPEAPPVLRLARGLRRHLEHAEPPAWEGASLYPAGAWSLYGPDVAVRFSYSHSLCFDRGAWQRQVDRCDHPPAREALAELERALSGHYVVGSPVPPEFRLGGDGFTHSIPNYGRVCREGLTGYVERVRQRLAAARAQDSEAAVALYEALEEVLAGVAALHRAAVARLRQARGGDAASEAGRQRLLAALERVPWHAARSFYEALVGTNFIYYLDGCDSLGRFDQDLGDYYDRDLAAGRLDADEGTRLVRQMWENVDANSGWNVALGGSTAAGEPAYNGLTRACLAAARSIRRPNLALRLRRDTPEDVFDLALEAIASGCGIPALYHEEGYLDALRQAHLNLRATDLPDFAFGGCTETMVHGKSNVGSLDAGINLPHVLTGTLARVLPTASDFAAVFAAYRADLRAAIGRLVDGVNQDQELKARHQPQPLRSLLIDDCIDAGVEYNAGGARYNWSVVNVGGLANAVDSLAAVRALVYEERAVSGRQLWEALEADFAGREPLRRQLEGCPRFGNDRPQADALAAELSRFVFSEFRRYAPWRGGRFLPACLMFVTYAWAGEGVMATPDGRFAGTPIADSAGPVQGRDRSGPTALVRSLSRIEHHLAPGTLVVNVRFLKDVFAPGSRDRLKALIRTYFELGGMQLQINVVDQQVLEDAIAHPERHQDLIVRVGGYSEYFNRLSPALQRSVLERTAHGV